MTTPANMVRLLTDCLERMGIMVERVKLEATMTGGGLCQVRGRQVVYLDRANSVDQDLCLLTEALRQAGGADTFLPPAVREWLDRTAVSS